MSNEEDSPDVLCDTQEDKPSAEGDVKDSAESTEATSSISNVGVNENEEKEAVVDLTNETNDTESKANEGKGDAEENHNSSSSSCSELLDSTELEKEIESFLTSEQTKGEGESEDEMDDEESNQECRKRKADESINDEDAKRQKLAASSKYYPILKSTKIDGMMHYLINHLYLNINKYSTANRGFHKRFPEGYTFEVEDMRECPPDERTSIIYPFYVGLNQMTQRLACSFKVLGSKIGGYKYVKRIPAEARANIPHNVMQLVMVFERMIRAHAKPLVVKKNFPGKKNMAGKMYIRDKRLWKGISIRLNKKQEMIVHVFVIYDVDKCEEIHKLILDLFKNGEAKEFCVTGLFVTCYPKDNSPEKMQTHHLMGNFDFEIMDGLSVYHLRHSDTWTSLYGLKMICQGVEELLGPTKTTSVVEVFCGSGVVGFYLSKLAGEILSCDEEGVIKETKQSALVSNITGIEYFVAEPSEIESRIKAAKYDDCAVVVHFTPNIELRVQATQVMKTLRKELKVTRMVLVITAGMVAQFPLKVMCFSEELKGFEPFLPVMVIPVDSKPFQPEYTFLILLERMSKLTGKYEPFQGSPERIISDVKNDWWNWIKKKDETVTQGKVRKMDILIEESRELEIKKAGEKIMKIGAMKEKVVGGFQKMKQNQAQTRINKMETMNARRKNANENQMKLKNQKFNENRRQLLGMRLKAEEEQQQWMQQSHPSWNGPVTELVEMLLEEQRRKMVEDELIMQLENEKRMLMMEEAKVRYLEEERMMLIEEEQRIHMENEARRRMGDAQRRRMEEEERRNMEFERRRHLEEERMRKMEETQRKRRENEERKRRMEAEKKRRKEAEERRMLEQRRKHEEEERRRMEGVQRRRKEEEQWRLEEERRTRRMGSDERRMSGRSRMEEEGYRNHLQEEPYRTGETDSAVYDYQHHYGSAASTVQGEDKEKSDGAGTLMKLLGKLQEASGIADTGKFLRELSALADSGKSLQEGAGKANTGKSWREPSGSAYADTSSVGRRETFNQKSYEPPSSLSMNLHNPPLSLPESSSVRSRSSNMMPPSAKPFLHPSGRYEPRGMDQRMSGSSFNDSYGHASDYYDSVDSYGMPGSLSTPSGSSHSRYDNLDNYRPVHGEANRRGRQQNVMGGNRGGMYGSQNRRKMNAYGDRKQDTRIEPRNYGSYRGRY